MAVSILVAGCQPRAAHELHPGGSAGRFRVSVWNVAESSFVRRPPVFRRILQATDADIFSFDEVGEHSLHARLRSEFARGVATNAAVVEVRGRRLLLVGLDLWARGGSPDSSEETRRRGRGGPFHSARMDVVIFSDLTLSALSARVVNWDDFPSAERVALGLTPTPVVGLSRHRPVVVDFEWR
ncbi:MAG: hypothetical protein WKF55_15470 [Gemmatimonadaceae bacterium]